MLGMDVRIAGCTQYMALVVFHIVQSALALILGGATISSGRAALSSGHISAKDLSLSIIRSPGPGHIWVNPLLKDSFRYNNHIP